MKFIAIDVETANADLASICQIGCAIFENGKLIDTWSAYVNPEATFTNSWLHDIYPEDVNGKGTFKDVYVALKEVVSTQVIVHHSAFDRVALNRACIRYNLPLLDCIWVDSTRIVKKVWSQFSKSGYGLINVANFLKIEYRPHDALEDAIATGKVVVKAIEKTTSINSWDEFINGYQNYNYSKDLKEHFDSANAEINIEGPLYGEIIVFTGTLSQTKIELAKIAASYGCTVNPRVTKKTTILLVGIQDPYKMAEGEEKSRKHRNAEKLKQEGQEIRILSEKDFVSLIDT